MQHVRDSALQQPAVYIEVCVQADALQARLNMSTKQRPHVISHVNVGVLVLEQVLEVGCYVGVGHNPEGVLSH